MDKDKFIPQLIEKKKKNLSAVWKAWFVVWHPLAGLEIVFCL